MVVNESLKFLLAKGQTEQVPIDIEMMDDAEEAEPPVSDVPPDVVHQMVSRLPTGYRTVLNLYVFEGKNHQEIARLLGITASTSSSQLNRAKHLLARMIQQYNDNIKPRQ